MAQRVTRYLVGTILQKIVVILLVALPPSPKDIANTMLIFARTVWVVRAMLLIDIHIVEVCTHIVIEAVLGVRIPFRVSMTAPTAASHTIVIVGFASPSGLGRLVEVGAH